MPGASVLLQYLQLRMREGTVQGVRRKTGRNGNYYIHSRICSHEPVQLGNLGIPSLKKKTKLSIRTFCLDGHDGARFLPLRSATETKPRAHVEVTSPCQMVILDPWVSLPR